MIILIQVIHSRSLLQDQRGHWRTYLIISDSKERRLELKNEDLPYEKRDHSLFVAFAPYKYPRYSISVLIEHGGSGSKAAAPLASKLIKKIIDRHKIRELTRKANITLA